MSDRDRIRDIITYHEKEAEDESKREVGDDPLYDGIAWRNTEPFLPKRGWILDAGGGAGVWSIRIAEKTNCDVVLFDVAPRLLNVARRRIRGLPVGRRIEILEADIRAIPLDDSSFDFVLCEGDPITICGDPDKAVSELARVLKADAYLAAGLDSTIFRAYRALSKGVPLDEAVNFLKAGKSPAEEGAAFESKSFTPTEFTLLAKKHGLEVVTIHGRPIGSSLRMLDAFVSAIPTDRRKEIFESEIETSKLIGFLLQIYQEPYVAAMGSHIYVVAKKSG